MISEVHETRSLLDLETVMMSLTTLLAMGGVAWRDVLTFEVTAPGMGAAALAMALWLNDLADWIPLPAGYDLLRLAGYQFPPFLILASLCWAIGLGFIVMNRRRIGIWKGVVT